jgi:hypothetical protein
MDGAASFSWLFDSIEAISANLSDVIWRWRLPG